MTVAAWSANDVVDLLIKLAPAVTIVGGLIAAQVQWRRQQRLNAELIAKNHYREMLEQLLRNADLLALGATPDALRELQAKPEMYRRYVLLFAIVSFALQEIYFATDPHRNKHWAEVIRLFFEPFRPFLSSDSTFTPTMSSSVDPEFARFVRTLMAPAKISQPVSN